MIRAILLATLAVGFVPWSAECAPSASREFGVAPLSVHFTADLVASSPGNMPFHDYEYAWDFGDPTSGTWGTSGKPKNTDKGPVASHVYETPGVFTATLTVRNSSGIIDTETFSITVQDPDLVFSGTKTTCISSTSDFTGCPSGANQVTTSDLSSIGAYTDAGERVLLRRGDSWGLTATPAFPNNAGPVHIGAYGTCSNPDELGICSNAPVVNLTGDKNTRFAVLAKKQDWRFADIEIVAPASLDASPIPIIGGTAQKKTLVFRVKTTGGTSALLADTWREVESDYMDDNAVVSCKFTDFGGTGVFVGSERLVLTGNIIQNSPETHVLRVWQAYQSVISHNILSGASLTNPSGRHALKLHGPSPLGAVGQTFVGDYADVGKSGLRNFTQFVVIANNVFGGSGPWPVSIGPQNVTYDERLSDILFEKNRSLADYGQLGPAHADCGVNVAGRYITIRNNIFDGTGGDSTYRGVTIETRLAARPSPWPTLGNRVYNNTIYSSKVHTSGAYGVQVDDTASDTIIKNNYVSFPNTINKDMILDNSGSVVASNNTMTDTPYFVDPDNSSPLARNSALTSSSTSAIGQGTTVPVFDDFLGLPRYGAIDIGAFRATPRLLFRNVRLHTEAQP